MYEIFISCLLSIVYCLFFTSCANIVNPSGGPKDTAPPNLVRASPDTFSTKFNSKEIILTFDEYIQLRDISSQLVVSPPLKNTPDIRVKKKSVIIRLNDTLAENTTYTLNFGNSIADITENNSPENFQYIFSTGDYIDSLSVEGAVMNAGNLSPEKGVLVMLYKNHADSALYKDRPSFFAKTDASGNFRINNIAKGEYRLTAIKDANSNYIYDQHGEAIAFSDSIVDPSKEKFQKLLLFTEVPAKQRLVKAFAEQIGKVVFIMAAPGIGIGPTPLNYKPKDHYVEFSEKSDTIVYWVADTTLDSLHAVIRDINGVVDTAHIALLKRGSPGLKKKKFELTVSSNIPANGIIDLNSPVRLLFSHPILLPDGIQGWEKNLVFTKDSIRDTLELFDSYPYSDRGYEFVKLDTVYVFDSLSSATIPVKTGTPYILEENKSYRIFLPPKSVTDIFGLANDTVKIDFKTKSEKDYGTLTLKLVPPADGADYIIRLVDDKDNVFFERIIRKEEKINCTFLQPKSYRIKVIRDENKNGKWDTGNYLKKKQPEKVFYYKQNITVRANWDVEAEWDFSKQ
jgi:uncharacterized protein (DUF2141 family)